jgi:hypothetical protein
MAFGRATATTQFPIQCAAAGEKTVKVNSSSLWRPVQVAGADSLRLVALGALRRTVRVLQYAFGAPQRRTGVLGGERDRPVSPPVRYIQHGTARALRTARPHLVADSCFSPRILAAAQSALVPRILAAVELDAATRARAWRRGAQRRNPRLEKRGRKHSRAAMEKVRPHTELPG